MFKNNSITSTSLGIRTVIGGYLIYLAYSLISSIQTASNTKQMVFWIGIVALFSVVGILLVFFSVKALIKGEYDKGTDQEDSNIENNEDSDKEEEITKEEEK